MDPSSAAADIFGTLAPGYSPLGALATAGLGALSSLGNMGASRLPYPTMQVVGQMAGGAANALNAQRQAAMQAQQLQMGGLNLALMRQKMDWLSKLFEGSDFGQEGGDKQGLVGGGRQTSRKGPPAPFANAASGAAPTGPETSADEGADTGEETSGAPAASTGTAAAAPASAGSGTVQTPNGASEPIVGYGGPIPKQALQSAFIYDMLVPGAGKAWLDRQFPGPTDFMRALSDYNNAPPALKPYALASLEHSFGDRFQLMRNGWAYDKLSGQWFHMPSFGEGVTATVGPNGQMQAGVVPGALPAIAAVSRAQASGPAAFKPITTTDQYGNEVVRPAADLGALYAAAPGPTPQGGPVNPATMPAAPGAPPGWYLRTDNGAPAGTAAVPAKPPLPAPSVPSAAPAPAPPPAAAAPAAQGAPAIDSAALADVIPAGMTPPARPPAAPGTFLGTPNPGTAEIQKSDAERLAAYNKQASEGQKIYQDVQMLQGVLQRGLTTGKLAPLWTDMTNIAQSMGLESYIPKNYDPNDAGVFNKVATDLTFAALKQLPGQPRVAEIEGLQKANPNMVLPPAANAEILHAILANQQWVDKRSDLATQYMAEYPGAPLGFFDARFNQKFPLVDTTAQVFAAARGNGWKLPGDKGTPSNPAGISVENMAKAQQIRAQVKAGTMTRADGLTHLKALGFQ